MEKKIIGLFIAVCCSLPLPVSACTLFGASGAAAAGGGTIICKNRDNPPQNQKLVVRNNGKYAYYALLGDHDGTEQRFSVFAGVNEKGLTVISAKASCITKEVYKTMPRKTGLSWFLKNCASVAELLGCRDKFTGPTYIMASDGREIAVVEISDKGEVNISRKTDGVLTHTNYYHAPEFQYLNMKKNYVSALVRQQRIDELMSITEKPLTVENFIAFSEDRHDGPTNSLWRMGKSKTGSQTIATFIVDTKADGDFTVRVKYREKPDEQGREKLVIKTRQELFGK